MSKEYEGWEVKLFRDLKPTEQQSVIETLAAREKDVRRFSNFFRNMFKPNTAMFCGFIKGRFVGLADFSSWGNEVYLDRIRCFPSPGIVKVTGKTVGRLLMEYADTYCRERGMTLLTTASVGGPRIKFFDRLKYPTRDSSRIRQARTKKL